MALWQYDLFLIEPDKALSLVDSSDADEREETANLCGLDIDLHTLEKYVRELPLAESWNDDLFIWGDLESNRIDCSFVEEKLFSAFVRFDMRFEDDDFMDIILRFANFHKLVFVDSRNKIVAANKFELKSAFGKSSASEYCKNPLEFLTAFPNNILH